MTTTKKYLYTVTIRPWENGSGYVCDNDFESDFSNSILTAADWWEGCLRNMCAEDVASLVGDGMEIVVNVFDAAGYPNHNDDPISTTSLFIDSEDYAEDGE